MRPRKLVILAAGKGERLRPLTETRPKPLMPILDKPLICRHLEKLSKLVNPDEVLIVVSYMKDLVEREVLKCYGGRIRIVEQREELGTGDAIKTAIEAGGEGEYIIVYGDLFLTEPAYSAIASMRPYSLLASRVKEPWNYGVLTVKDDRVVSVVEKPPREQVASDLVYSGALAVDHEFLKYLSSLRPSPRGEYEVTDAINNAARELDFRMVTVDGSWWIDIGRPWDYLLAVRKALEELSASVRGQVHSTAIIEGAVYIHETAEVGPYVVIEGPAYIGPRAKVGPHTHIRPYTALLAGAKAGYAVEIKASVLMEGAAAPHLNYVGDSVIGEHVNLGAGTITANLRFDHKTVKMYVKGERVDTGLPKLGAIMGGYSQTGINVSLMPGVKVGSYAVIYPGCVVYTDVPSGHAYKCASGDRVYPGAKPEG